MLLRDSAVAGRWCIEVAWGPPRSHFLLPHSKPPPRLLCTINTIAIPCCTCGSYQHHGSYYVVVTSNTAEPHSKPPLLQPKLWYPESTYHHAAHSATNTMVLYVPAFFLLILPCALIPQKPWCCKWSPC